MQQFVTSATHTHVFKISNPKKTSNIFGMNTLGPQTTDLVESLRNW